MGGYTYQDWQDTTSTWWADLDGMIEDAEGNIFYIQGGNY